MSFDDTAGTDSIFATSDTASRPDADISTLEARRAACGLFLQFGVVRIGKSQAAGDFSVVPQTTAQFGQEPKPSCPNNDLHQTTDCDPQGSGARTLSLFRRPAAQTLLLSETCDTPVSPSPCTPTLTPAQEHDIARFMSGVFTAQESDTAAGLLSARGAAGGVQNLVSLAASPNQPCRFAAGALTVFTPAGCAPAGSPTMTLFSAWAGLGQAGDGRNAARAAVVRGQALFNGGVRLHGSGGITARATCHALNNLGNNPSDAGTNLRTTDPGRAMVSGRCADDLGALKPPLLRDVAVRAPYFHNAAAATLDDVVNFYNVRFVRFTIGLSAQQHDDLVAFLRTL